MNKHENKKQLEYCHEKMRNALPFLTYTSERYFLYMYTLSVHFFFKLIHRANVNIRDILGHPYSMGVNYCDQTIVIAVISLVAFPDLK